MSEIKDLPISLDRVDRIFHLADVHIRNYKRHTEYKEVFERLYDNISENKTPNSLIAVLGDVAHAKTDMSPELVDMIADFFRRLADMRPTLVIPGNHDLLESNLNRLDAISPIVKALGHPDLHYVKENGLFRVGNVVFSHFSIFEEPSNYVRAHEIPDEYKKVALYHGIVDRATTDVGYMLTSDKMTPSIFQGFDMALLGDIHRRQHVTEKREEIIHVDEEEVQNYLDNGWKLA